MRSSAIVGSVALLGTSLLAPGLTPLFCHPCRLHCTARARCLRVRCLRARYHLRIKHPGTKEDRRLFQRESFDIRAGAKQGGGGSKYTSDGKDELSPQRRKKRKALSNTAAVAQLSYNEVRSRPRSVVLTPIKHSHTRTHTRVLIAPPRRRR